LTVSGDGREQRQDLAVALVRVQVVRQRDGSLIHVQLERAG